MFADRSTRFCGRTKRDSPSRCALLFDCRGCSPRSYLEFCTGASLRAFCGWGNQTQLVVQTQLREGILVTSHSTGEKCTACSVEWPGFRSASRVGGLGESAITASTNPLWICPGLSHYTYHPTVRWMVDAAASLGVDSKNGGLTTACKEEHHTKTGL